MINGDKCSLVTNYIFVDIKTKTLQEALNIELEETENDKMINNESKCLTKTFNFSKNNIPPQDLKLTGNIIEPIEPENTIKILGVYITSSLRWRENTSNICSKVNRKLYIINKSKHFGLEKEELITDSPYKF